MVNVYKRIKTHQRPGLDEIVSIFLLKRYGYELGIDQDIPVRFMVDGDFENPAMSEAPGVLYVGCGRGSWANEHYSQEEERSASYLVARELGLDRRRYGFLIDAVTHEDRHGTKGIKNHIAQAIKDLYDMGWNYNQVYAWVKPAIIALTDYKSKPERISLDTETCTQSIEKKFGKGSAREWSKVVADIKLWDKGEFIKACAYLKKNPQLFKEVETYKGTMKAFIPDQVQFNARIGSAARSLGAQIVLMQGSLDYGQVGIVLQQKHTAELSFSRVLEELRKHELLNRGEANLDKMGICSGEGTLEVCPIWHGHQSVQGQFETFAIYNRSKSRPLGPQTAMSWEYIKDLILDTLKKTPKGEIVKGSSQLFLAGGANNSLHRAFENKKMPSMLAKQ